MATLQSLILSMLRSLWTTFDSPKIQDSRELEPAGSPSPIDLERLALPSDLAYLPKIQYAYDPLPAVSLRLKQSLHRLPSGATAVNQYSSRNSIRLDPFSAGLPYRSSIDHVQASKYWKTNLSETIKLLELLAADDSASDIEVDHGITLTKLAKKALRPGLEHQMVLATQYMFPSADEQRIRQIAALMIIYFVFDDKVEETPNDKLSVFRNDFLRRLEGHRTPNSKPSAFQSYMDGIINSIEAEDKAGGDGGKGMLEALRQAFRCVHPNNGFRTVDDYFRFRHKNVGAAFVIAAAKFSVQSRASVADPRFSRYLALASDHLGLVNDLASYDKELRALNRGETGDMINMVDVLKAVTSLQGTDEAKAVAWSLQLQIERQIMDELEGLRREGGVTDDEWWFLEAVASAAAGNVMFCMTTSRYGGEAARI